MHRLFLENEEQAREKFMEQCFSTEMEVACENSANLEQEPKTTKIVTYPLFPLASSFVPFSWLFKCEIIEGFGGKRALGILCKIELC